MLPCELQCQTATLQAVELLGKLTNFFLLGWYQLRKVHLTANLSHHHLDSLDYLYTEDCTKYNCISTKYLTLLVFYSGMLLLDILDQTLWTCGNAFLTKQKPHISLLTAITYPLI